MAAKADLKDEAMLYAVQEQVIRDFVECVTRKVKQYLILRVNVKSWHKRSTREGMIMLQK